MSASPAPQQSAHPQKRPLEDPSSEPGLEDQHDAKRPALGVKEDTLPEQTNATDNPANGTAVKRERSPSVKPEPSFDNPAAAALDIEANGVSDESPAPRAESVATQPIQSTTTANGIRSVDGPPPKQQSDESQWLHVRAILTGQEAATLIGKGGENVNQIRKLSGAKCTVSEYSRGAVERILTVSGATDAVAKVSSEGPMSYLFRSC